MIILHTADIHFGPNMNHDLARPTQAIIDIAKEEQPNLIVIAGDLTTERGIIDNETAVVCRTFVRQLASIAPVLICAGNHDLTYRDDVPDNLHAIFSDDFGPVIQDVQIVDTPEVLLRDDAAIAVIPYPSAATFHANTGETDLQVLSLRLAEVARGLAAEAKATGRTPLIVYHGTVEGGRMGDEGAPSLKTRGHDIVMPSNALAGFAGGLFGHLHHPQRIALPDGFGEYSGCVAPLTFGELSIQPGMLLWEVSDGKVETRRIPLPVTHQRLEIEVGPEDWDEGADATLNLVAWLEALPGSIKDARLKVKLTLPRPRLQLFTPELIEAVRQGGDLHELKIDRTELETENLVLQEGVDRAARVDVVEALVTYADTTEDPAFIAHLPEVQELGRKIEEEIGVNDLDPRYEFEPTRLEVTNYKTITHADINFAILPARTGVFGPTGIGKSNLILAIAAALYGGNPKSEIGKAKTTAAEMVRRGEKLCRLRLEFKSKGAVYRITRVVKVGSTGKAAGKLFFDQTRDGGSWEPVSGNVSRETQETINALVGPPELHWLTRHLRQHGTSAVKMGSSDLADSVNSTLQLDFEIRAKRGSEAIAVATTARDAAQIRANTLREQAGNVAQLGATLAEAQADVEKWTAEIAAVDSKIKERTTKLDETKHDVAQTQARLDTIAPLVAERAQKFDSLAQSTARLASAKAALAALVAEADIPALEVDVAGVEARQRCVADELKDLTQRGHELDLEERDALNGLGESARSAERERVASSNRLTSAQSTLSTLTGRAALVETVPCGGGEWMKSDGSVGTSMAACPLLTDAFGARDKIAAATAAIDAAKAQVCNAQADERAAKETLEDHRVEVESTAIARSREVAGVTTTLRDVEKRLSEARSSLQAARENEANASALRTSVEVTRDRVELLTAEFATLADKIEDTDVLNRDLATGRALIEETDGHIAQLKSEKRGAEHVVSLAKITVGTTQEKIDAAQKAEAEIVELDVEYLKQERTRVAATYYTEAVQRQGIPSLLLRQLAPQLQARCNDILAPTGRQIRIQAERELTSGKTKTEVNLQFSSPTSGDEFVPIAELSGGEEDLANVALAVGLACVAADMTATPLGMVVLDEPFTGVSAEHEDAAREVLAHIQSHVDRVMIITHKRDLMPMVDASLVLSQNGAGTVVEVVR